MSIRAGYRWRRGVAAFVLTLPMAAVSACDERPLTAASTAGGSTGTVDSAGRAACAEFRSGWQRATDTSARLRLADTVGRPARRSDSAPIAAAAAEVGRSANEGDRAWRTAAARLLRACRGAGEGSVRPALPVTG